MSASVSTGQLRLLIVLARAGIVADAASELGVSRRSLRQMARNFEQQIGVSLFVWSRNRVDLTDAGAVFIARAHSVMDLLHRAVAKINGNVEVLDQLVVPTGFPDDPADPTAIAPASHQAFDTPA